MKSEARIQQECFQWFNNTYPHLRGLMFHVPNGEKRDAVTGSKLKAMGVVAGIPDIVFLYRAKAYFFEFKDDEKSKPSPAQVRIHKRLDEQRFHVWVVWDQDTFKYLVQQIILDTSERNTWGLTREDYEFKHKIFDYLYNIKAGEIISIDEICSVEKKDKFIYYITEFIQEGYADLANFEILFTANFRCFYKSDETVDRESLIKKYSIHQWAEEKQ